jgi:adenosylcobinamide-phosphate synthase
MTNPAILLSGWLLDLLLGDPARLPHPVVGFGRWIAFWEKRLNKGNHRVAKGAVVAVGSIALTALLTWLLILPQLWEAFLPHSIVSILTAVVSAVLIFYCLAGHTLRREVRMVFEAVDRSLDDGRRQVARIVGRDTGRLSAQEVRTAALETLAENLSDGVIAPLFWLAIGGVPAMMAYKMVNTLDSMIGYRNERYLHFGRWAARIDDVANYIPARLTAFLIIIANTICRPASHFSLLTHHFSTLFRYGPCHASPNSGWPEAALAACLDCRFGGTHDYFGQPVEKPYIGDTPRPLTTADMQRSLRIALIAEVMAVAIVTLLTFV